MSGIKKELIRGILFTGIAKYSGLAVSLLVTAILARNLQPEEFGIVAIGTFFINFFSTLTISGISPAIIQHRELNETDIENIYTFTIYLGLLLSILFIACSPIIADFYGNSHYLSNICRLLSVEILFSIFVIVPNSLLLKEKRFRFISLRMLVVNLTGAALSVLSLFFGFGIYALVVNPIFSSAAIYLVTIRKRPVHFHFSVSWRSVRKILSFSVYQMLFNFVYLIYRGVDKLIIGKFFNLKDLGYYEKSYRLMMLPLENITGVVQPVLHPLLSEFQKDESFVFSVYIKIIRFLSDIGFLLSVILFFTAKEWVIIIFGTQWLPSVPVFQILALSVGVQMAQSPAGIIFQTFYKVRELFYCSLGCLFLVLTAVFSGTCISGINMVATLLVISFYLIFLIYNFVICKLTHESFRRVVTTVIFSMLKASLLLIVLFVMDLIICIDNIFISLSLKCLLAFLYLAAAIYVKMYKDIPLPVFISKYIK